jgi:hypothetical protein
MSVNLCAEEPIAIGREQILHVVLRYGELFKALLREGEEFSLFAGTYPVGGLTGAGRTESWSMEHGTWKGLVVPAHRRSPAAAPRSACGKRVVRATAILRHVGSHRYRPATERQTGHLNC